MSFLLFILLLALLILVHEFGHFSVAKFFGIRVDEFGIGFPPKLFGVKYGETLYSLNAIFFGGFVRIFGENPDASGVEDPRSFAQKPRLVQASVVLAGIVCNILFAWLALSICVMFGLPTSVEHKGVGVVQNPQVTVVAVMAHAPADVSGIRASDTISSLQTATTQTPALDAATVRAFIAAHQDESIVVTVVRGGETKTFLARPESGFIEGKKAIGVELDDIGTLKLGFPLAFVQGAVLTYNMTIETAQGLGAFFTRIATGKADFSSVAGPIGIVGVGAKAVGEGFVPAFVLAALISINLALMNLLPIPGLDGGRFVVICIEGIRGKPLSEKLLTGLMLLGFAFLVLTMVIVSYHDIVRLIQ